MATPPTVDLDHFGHRIIQDALAEATSRYWNRRAAAFEHVGTPAADETAQACRNAAQIATWPDDDPDAIVAEHLTDQLATRGTP